MEQKENDNRKKNVIIFGLLLVMAVVIFGFNFYRLKQITVEGLTRYTKEEFLNKVSDAPWNLTTPLFCLSDVFLQKEIPFVEKYEIIYEDRQTARIVVHEKRVTGCVIIMGRYMFFDKDGIVVESSAKRMEGIPVVTGLKFNEITLYRELQVQKQSLFDTILQLTRLIEQNKIKAEEIAFDSNYEVTLYAGDVKVLLGKRTNYDEPLNALAGILEAMGERKGTLEMKNYSRENSEVILKEEH